MKKTLFTICLLLLSSVILANVSSHMDFGVIKLSTDSNFGSERRVIKRTNIFPIDIYSNISSITGFSIWLNNPIGSTHTYHDTHRRIKTIEIRRPDNCVLLQKIDAYINFDKSGAIPGVINSKAQERIVSIPKDTPYPFFISQRLLYTINNDKFVTINLLPRVEAGITGDALDEITRKSIMKCKVIIRTLTEDGRFISEKTKDINVIPEFHATMDYG